MATPSPSTDLATDSTRGAVTFSEAADLLACGRTVVFQLAKAGRIRRVRLPGVARPRLLRADVERIVAEGVETP